MWALYMVFKDKPYLNPTMKMYQQVHFPPEIGSGQRQDIQGGDCYPKGAAVWDEGSGDTAKELW